MKVLFICLGNICRSPTAEGVFQSQIQSQSLESRISCDSAGTSAHHEGASADARSQDHAQKRGYQLNSLSRPLKPSDLEDFDLLLTMDEANFSKVMYMAKQDQADTRKIKRFADFCKIHQVKEVPDPYHKGDEGFELVLDIIEDGCTQLIEYCKSKVDFPSSAEGK